MVYSQHGEENAILTLLDGTGGRFLDVGAADGVTFSNTRALAEMGWGGVVVDAAPHFAAALRYLYRDRDDIEVMEGACILEETDEVEFWNTPDFLGTTERIHMEKWREFAPFEKIKVHAFTPWDLLGYQPGPYGMVNIDTEGTSLDLFWAFVMEGLTPEVWCVEHDGKHEDVEEYLSEQGYARAFLDGNNIVMGRTS